MRKAFFIVILLAFAVFLTALITRTKPERPVLSPPVPAAPEDTIIRIINNQFVPQDIVVREGKRVWWVNEDAQLHWVASDPHPTHTNLPRLDSLGELQHGESFSFTFMNVGRFSYHDHAAALKNGEYARGSVSVAP